MLKRLLLLCAMLLLASCASVEQIKDFQDRSLGYGWLDIKEVDGNRLHAVSIYQFRPQTDRPYFPARALPFKDGFLYFSMVLPNGSHRAVSASGQTCIGILCGNTVYEYSFGKQGDEIGAVVIKSPGVYWMGAYKLKKVKTGFFEQGKFDVEPAKSAPSKREILEEILKDVTDEPVVAERIKRELATMK